MYLTSGYVYDSAEQAAARFRGDEPGDLYSRYSNPTLAMLEERLAKAPYLAGGSFTAADIITFFPLTTMRAFVPRDLSAFPNIRAYLKRIGARPAYQRAMAKGDPGMALLLS